MRSHPRVPLVLAGLIALAAPAMGQEADRIAQGGDLFVQYCATCHGRDARGGGPMQSVLLVAVPDLTDLAARADGFPHFDVVAKIDGSDPLVSHGSVMPVWGQFFEGESAFLRTEAGQPIVTSAPIAALVAWLESIQQ